MVKSEKASGKLFQKLVLFFAIFILFAVFSFKLNRFGITNKVSADVAGGPADCLLDPQFPFCEDETTDPSDPGDPGGPDADADADAGAGAGDAGK